MPNERKMNNPSGTAGKKIEIGTIEEKTPVTQKSKSRSWLERGTELLGLRLKPEEVDKKVQSSSHVQDLISEYPNQKENIRNLIASGEDPRDIFLDGEGKAISRKQAG